MAAPVYATDLTDIIVEMPNTTGWTALGGGAAGLSAPETDAFIQGNNSISKAAWTAGAERGMIYTDVSRTVPTDGAVLFWLYYMAPNASRDLADAAGAFNALIGNSSSAYYAWAIAGADTMPFGGWQTGAVNPTITTRRRTIGSPSGTWSNFGSTVSLAAGLGPSKGNPLVIDAIRFGRVTLTCTNGDGTAGYASFGGNGSDAGAAAYDNNVTRRWGHLTPRDGVFFLQGFLSLGSSGTAVDFRDSNRVVFIRNVDLVTSAFNRVEVLNASSNVEWTNISMRSLSTVSRGTFVHTAGALSLSGCEFVDMDTFSFLAAASVRDTTFRRCNAITTPGTDMRGSKVLASNVGASANALIWNVATDPDGKLDDMEFSKGTAAHHAIEFGTSSPLTMTLRGIAFSGFNASNGQADSTLRIGRTSGTVTINLVGCTGNISYATGGATVNLVVNPVTLAVHVEDINTGSPIQNARVWVPVTSNAGGKPYQASVTITRSASTATVTHTSHGLATNDYVWIQGANELEYNGTFQITVTGANTYTYTVSGTPATPATGTITSTFVVISGVTDASGDISASYTWTANQPVSGRVRRATTGALYKTAPVVGTISSTGGLSVTIQMIPDG